jgi:hypothetical protein
VLPLIFAHDLKLFITALPFLFELDRLYALLKNKEKASDL